MKKYILGLGLAATMFGAFSSVHAVTIDELQAQVQALLVQLQALKTQQVSPAGATVGGSVNTSSTSKSLNDNLGFGLTDNDDVRTVQDYLRAKGYFTGESSGNFFTLTFNAVKKFQADNGLDATGFVGPKTRAVLNGVLSSSVNTGTTNVDSSVPPTVIEKTSTSVSLTANGSKGQITVQKGATVNLTWKASANLGYCAGPATSQSHGNGVDGISGYVLVYPSETTTYSIHCYKTSPSGERQNGYPDTSASVTVNVSDISMPHVSLSASPASITVGQSSKLTESVSGNTQSCNRSYSVNNTDMSGTFTVTPSTTTTYTITCYSSNSLSSTASVIVYVGSAGPSGPTISADRSTIQSGDAVHLTLGKYPTTAVKWSLSEICPSGVTVNQKGGGCMNIKGDTANFTDVLNFPADSSPSQMDWQVNISNISDSKQTISFVWNAMDANGATIMGDTSKPNHVEVSVYPESTVPSLQVLSPNGGETYNATNNEINISYTSRGLTGHSLTASLYSDVYGSNRAMPIVASSNGTFSMNIQKVSYPEAGQYKINICADGVANPEHPYAILCDASDSYFTLQPDTRPVVWFLPDQATVANNYTITAGQSVTLQWSSSDATSCTFEGATVPANSTKVVSPTSTRDYYITCVNSNAALVNGQPPQSTSSLRLVVNPNSGANVYSALQSLLQQLSNTIGH